MEIRVKTIKFDATQKLEEFIQKKVGKLQKYCNDDAVAEVTLKVTKPATALNKEVSIDMDLSGASVFVSRVCDTFEDAITQCIPIAERQLVRYKERQMAK